MTLVAPQPARTPAADPEALFREARQRRRRRRMFLFAVVLLVLVGVGLGYGLTNGKIQPTRPLAARTLPPRTVAPQDLSATTAYVADASGLVPVSLATGRVGPSIAIPGYDGTANLVGAPNGKTAYVVALPTPTHPGIDESGPSLVPVNLQSRQLGQPIDFRATAVQVEAAASQSMFDLAGLAITPNGRTVLVADEADHSVIPVNVVTRRVGRPIVLPVERTISSLIRAPLSEPSYTPVQPAQFGDIAVNPDGTTAYVSDGYSVIPISLTRHRALAPITGFDAPSMIAVSPSGRFAYVTNPYCWEEISTGDCIATPRTPVVEPNGKIQLYAGGQFVNVVDLRSNRIVGRIDFGKSSQPTGVAVSPDGAELSVTFGQFGQRGNQIAVVSTRTDRVEARIDDRVPLSRNQGADDIAVSPDGKEAFLSSFAVVTPGPYGPVTLRGVVVVNLESDMADPAISFGAPVANGTSTGPVVFGG
jgi:DNA-binding beta-propeller fold protein YncE